MEITYKKEQGITVVAINGRLDATTMTDAEDTLDEIMAMGSKNLLFDLSELEYLSSGGLRIILAVAKQIKQKNGKLALCALQGYVKEIFEVSGFHKIIPIKESVEEGISEMQ